MRLRKSTTSQRIYVVTCVQSAPMPGNFCILALYPKWWMSCRIYSVKCLMSLCFAGPSSVNVEDRNLFALQDASPLFKKLCEIAAVTRDPVPLLYGWDGAAGEESFEG
ncbi:hypothetical protein AB6A40_006702 [Gnathostoma spinigerum]|uniref:Uncharacterized protein n=1 Tax=Gnathostoma spinigerum TaxID=75299 RepID=A0ABD6ESI7_9BILA